MLPGQGHGTAEVRSVRNKEQEGEVRRCLAEEAEGFTFCEDYGGSGMSHVLQIRLKHPRVF